MPAKEDDFTSTVEGAAAFEQNRGRNEGPPPDEDRPTRAEAERDAALDRDQEAREAKAAGEFDEPWPGVDLDPLDIYGGDDE